jgi:non-specific protein-tyrosine kinase
MELKQYASILWRWLWLIIMGAVLAGVSAYVTSRLTKPVYAASATLLINQAPSSQVSDYTAILTSERLARTYSELLKGRPVLDEVIASAKLSLTADELSKRIEVKLVRDTQLIELTVESEDPRLAALLANQIPEIFSRQNEEMQSSRYAASKASLSKELDGINAQIQQTQQAIDKIGTPGTTAQEAELTRLQAELTQFRQSYASLLQSYENIRVAEAGSISNIVIVEPAAMPTVPVRPKTLLNTALAAVVGLMLAVGVVFLIEYLDDSVRSAEQASQVLQLPVIGTIARLANGKGNGKGSKFKLIASAEPRSPVTEAFRSLRTNIQFSSVDKPIHTILITSAGPAEGKSMVSANLAVVMAQAGLRVVLLDADLRRPTAHKFLNRPNRNGLTDLVLQASTGWEGSVQETAVRNLALVSSGQLPPNPSELLGSQKMQQLLKRLAEHSDIVVIDSPPLLAVTDASVLARVADAVLMVLDADTTRIGAALQAKAQLEQVGAKLIGLVMNKIPVGRGGYYQYYHYYTDDKARRPAPAGRGWLPWRWPRKPAAEDADVPPAPSAPPGERSSSDPLADQKSP